ncbi:MAG: hypothetical protein AAB642_01255 [Patescibacteria group bacterium]
MPFRNIKPLHILWQQDLGKGMLSGVFFGIARVLLLAKVSQQIKLKHLGKRRQPNWLGKDGATLTMYQSLDWHIGWARKNSKKARHLNSVVLLDSLKDNPTYETEPRYELVVVNQPLHWSDTSLRTVSGVGRKNQGAIISLASHLHLFQPVIGESDGDKMKRRIRFWLATQMLAMHELGHIFGLFPGTSAKDPSNQELKEAHCLNQCVMYWQEDTGLERKIWHKPFCPSCLEKLKQFFVEP